MRNKGTQRKSLFVRKLRTFSSRGEFVGFVGDQFKQIVKRNLGLPMKLYHL